MLTALKPLVFLSKFHINFSLFQDTHHCLREQLGIDSFLDNIENRTDNLSLPLYSSRETINLLLSSQDKLPLKKSS